jgi:hypothetical protein
MRNGRSRYANVASTLALVLALGGTAYAAAATGPDGSPLAKRRGLPEARSYHDEDAGSLTGSSATVVGSLGLRAGNWVVVAKLWVNNTGGTDHDVLCALKAGNDTDLVWGTPNSGAPATTMAFNIVHRAAGNERAVIECNANGGTFQVFDLKITAIEVGKIRNVGGGM